MDNLQSEFTKLLTDFRMQIRDWIILLIVLGKIIN